MKRSQFHLLLGLAFLTLLAGGALVWLGLRGVTPAAAPRASDPAALAATLTQASAAVETRAPTEPPAAPPSPSPSAPAAADPLACLPGGVEQDGRVVEVLPGGVLRVELDGAVQPVKLLGADPAGSGGQALGLLRELAEGKTVRLLRAGAEADAAGSLLRYAVADGVFLDYELVRRGAALPALYPPGQVCAETLLAAEEQAKAEGLGYWALSPTPSGAPAAAAPLPAGQVCDCAVSYQCSDFTTRQAAQACYNACGDYRNISLDEDKNGLACEQLP